jgi:RHS repeat-associated protein
MKNLRTHNNHITAGNMNYLQRQQQLQHGIEEHYRELHIPPGNPTQKPYWGQPEQTGEPIPTVAGNYEIPRGWPREPVFNPPGGPPGPPIQFGEPQTNDNVTAGYGYLPNSLEERDLYFYHPDHLGSTSIITDKAGVATQFVCYMPFGEPLVDEHVSRKEMPYKFNGKEIDEETGLYYYGARYYDAGIGVWYGVDKMQEKYPGVSTYAYCSNNPLIYVDPDGKFAVPIHRNITQQAIDRSGIASKTSQYFQIDLVWGATKWADHFNFWRDFHFDGRANYSAVQERWNSLNNTISTTINNIGGGNKQLGGSDVVKLGRLVHNVQDFYAHSNYAELYMEYYQGANNGALPTSLPTYDEGIKNADFNSLLKDKLRTGDFHLLDNEKVDINPFREHANEPISHNKMNKDNANTYAGKLAKEAAIKHTTKILKEVE